MADDDIVHEIAEATKQYSGKDGFAPDEYERLKTAVHDDILPLVRSERSFFILGSYDDAERTRLRSVEDRLDEEGHAFLMLDTTEAWDYWTTQFKILATRATYIVGVYEHADGGHEWEQAISITTSIGTKHGFSNGPTTRKPTNARRSMACSLTISSCSIGSATSTSGPMNRTYSMTLSRD